MSRWLIAFAAAVALASAFSAQAKILADEPSHWFDQYGKPQPKVQHWAQRYGLPKVVRGVPFAYPPLSAKDNIGCVTVHFLVLPDGATDKLYVMDSRPKGRFDKSVLDSFEHWQFERTPSGARAVVPVQFGFDSPTGSHLDHWDDGCVLPEVTVDTKRSPKALQQALPLYPPKLVESRTQGCVAVSFSVRADGLADDYELIRAKPPSVFVPTVMAAMNEWRFPKGQATSGHLLFTFGIPGVPTAVPHCDQVQKS